MKKSLHLLTITAISSTLGFLGLIAFGLISLQVFLASLGLWFALVCVRAYKTPAYHLAGKANAIGVPYKSDLPYAA